MARLYAGYAGCILPVLRTEGIALIGILLSGFSPGAVRAPAESAMGL